MKTLTFILSTATLAISATGASADGFCSKYDCVAMADSIITQDSKRWFLNRFDAGSVRLDDESVWESPSGLKVKYKVFYTFNGGAAGWAELSVRDGEFDCIRYHDFPNECRTGPKF